MGPATQHANETHENIDDVDIDGLFMEADRLGAATDGDASLLHVLQQQPTAAASASLDQTGSAQLDIRRQSPTPDPSHQTSSSSAQARRAGQKRKGRHESPPSQAGAPSISPALSQTTHSRPAKKHRGEDVSSAGQPEAAPRGTPDVPEATHLRPVRKQKAAQSSGAQKRRGADATPARQRAAKRAAKTASPFPELSPDEIAQAKADGIVWARIGNYESWPAQVSAIHSCPIYIQ